MKVYESTWLAGFPVPKALVGTTPLPLDIVETGHFLGKCKEDVLHSNILTNAILPWCHQWIIQVVLLNLVPHHFSKRGPLHFDLLASLHPSAS